MSEQVQVSFVDDAEVDVLFGGKAPESTFNVSDLETKPKKEVEKEDNQEGKAPEAPSVEITEEDQEALFENTEEDKKTSPKKKKETISKSINYKDIVDYMVEEGKWVDFEGREDLEDLTEEEYLAIQEQQDSFRVDKKYNETLDKTGNYGKAIIEYEKNGGNPEKLLELFKEQRNIQNVDLSDSDNQEQVIRAYYEALDEDEAWIDEYVESLKDRGEDAFKKDAEKKHAKLLETSTKEIQNAQREQLEYKKAQIEAEQAYNQNIKKTIYNTEELSNAEKKDLEKFLIQKSYKLQDGREVNGLFVKMLEIQKDANKYVKFAKFIQDMDKYEEKLKKEATKETVKKQWRFLKDSEEDMTKKTSIMPEEGSAKKRDPFSLTFKN